MNYRDADSKLQGRCQQSRKLANNTYLQRRNLYENGKDAIAVRLHDTDVLTLHPNGKITVSTGGWDTPTTRDRINSYLPKPWAVYGERGATILSNHRWIEVRRKNGSEWVRRGTAEVLLHNSAVINPNGTVNGGESAEEFRKQVREADNERKRERARLNRWLEKARGLYRDNSECTRKDGWCSCHPRRGGWSRRRRWLVPDSVCSHCGCKAVYRKPNLGRLTVKQIMEEQNASVRVAMMKVYGLERFFVDAKPEIVNEEAGYQLLRLTFAARWNDQRITVLKMTCPSTSVAYIQAVPPNTQTVRTALNWIFDVPEGHDYLTEVVQAA